MFIPSGLWPQQSDLNPVNYKICTEMQQKVYLNKVHNVHGLILWHGFEPRISKKITDDWHKRLQVCAHFEGGLIEYLV